MVAINYITTFILALTTIVSAYPGLERRAKPCLKVGQHSPALPTDYRSPCPGINVMANAGFFPRSGRAYTFDIVVNGFEKIMNVSPAFTGRLMTGALGPDNDPTNFFGMRTPSSPEGFLNLNDTVKHGRVEHDASLSRHDYPASQDKPSRDLVLDMVTRAADCKTFTLADMARYRVDRYNYSKKNNPNFTYTLPKEDFLAYGEAALALAVLGDEEFNVPVEFLVDFFWKEKIPEGWKRPVREVTGDLVRDLSGRLRNMSTTFDLTVDVPRCQSIKLD
ncbi:hypothetical protein HDV05_007423 [Chytridiales sp. JEL 0842]|nr:hypothetical protein HDV05_007423 [Chytridiales sp. JEL 0842]